MSDFKQNLINVIDSALELANECEQNIDVRGAIIKLKAAKGSIAMATCTVVNDIEVVQPEVVIEVEGSEETATAIFAEDNILKVKK